MTDLDQAREWAESVSARTAPDGAHAAADLIQSLPDRWVDAEEVRKIIEEMESLPDTTRVSNEIAIATEAWKRRLEALLPAKLPTLADMDEDDRHTMIGEDVNVEGWNNPSMLIAVHKNEGAVLGHDWINPWPFVEVRSLSELTPVNPTADQPARSSGSPESPLLCPEGCCGKCPETASGGWDCTCEDNPRCSKNAPNPEDVPPNEPWLIEANGQKAVGTRYEGNAVVPWSVASLDGSFAGDYNDNEITLIHKLVPEPPALPEGMRLADHEKFGRVVTSPWGDGDDDYKIFHLNEYARTGADYGFAHESRLTFLGGGQHV